MIHIYRSNFLIVLAVLFMMPVKLVAQAPSAGTVPNYIFAENAQSVVHLDYVDLNEAIWGKLVRVITDGLKSVGIEPGPVLKLDKARMQQEPNYLDDQRKEKLSGGQPYYVISISYFDKKGLMKKYKSKHNFTPSDIKQVTLMIYRADVTGYNELYVVHRMTASYKELIEKLGEDIAAKPSSYFLKEVDREAIEKSDDALNEMPNKLDKMFELDSVGEGLDSYPTDLTEKTLLVVHKYTENSGIAKKDAYSEKWIGWAHTFLKKFYPGEYRLVSKMNYGGALKDGDYKYVLVPISALKLVKYNDQYTSGNVTVHSTKERLVAVFDYVLKNIETNEVYYGPPIERKKLSLAAKENEEVKGSTNMALNLKFTLKLMGKHYKWE